jgi:hypothetical protein
MDVRRRSRGAGLFLALGLVLAASGTAHSKSTSGVAEEGDIFANSVAAGDFNNDGRADLAVGVPGEDIGGGTSAGAVNLVYGSSSGLTETDDEVWYQGTTGIQGAPENQDGFGGELAVGDFDDDGIDDLAVGVLGEDIGGEDGAGAVNVIYGSPSGLTEVDNQLLMQEEPEEGDVFGRSLAAGDFTGDGRDDLAVGAPGESLENQGVDHTGVVNRFLGEEGGLSETSLEMSQTSLDDDVSEEDDGFGWSLAAGNLGAGAEDDLVIGVPDESLSESEQGAVHVLYGGTGFQPEQFWHQDVPGVANVGENNDDFGRAVAVGNFGNGGPQDLAIGVHSEDIDVDAGEVTEAGAVHVLYGTSELGLSEDDDQLWHQSRPGIRERIEPFDEFGSSLAAGNLGNGRHADLIIAASGDDIDSSNPKPSRAGVVHVLFGSPDGLTASKDDLWHQDVDGVKDKAEFGDRLGNALAVGNFGSGSARDLAIGVRLEDLGAIADAGGANVLYGTADGPSPAGDHFWHQSVP